LGSWARKQLREIGRRSRQSRPIGRQSHEIKGTLEVFESEAVDQDCWQQDFSLEKGFWEALTEIVKERQTTLQELVTSINAERRDANLSSAVRVFILDHFAANKRSTRSK